MTLSEKIEFLDKLCDGTLTITHFVGWELSSYGDDSLLSYNANRIGPVKSATFAQCVDEAMEKVHV